jgi:nicotinamidase-related amidase
MASPTAARQIPPGPDPVAVRLDPATTALLVMDITEPTCSPQPNCRAMLPRIGSLVARAREAGALIAYTSGAAGGAVLPEAEPAPDDPVIQGGQNKFFNTTLDGIMRTLGITTVVLAGWRANGSVLFTSHGATVLGYTVVVVVDGTAAAQDFEVAIGLYQVLNLLNGNPTNEPLKPGAVTLSRTDLITFER